VNVLEHLREFNASSDEWREYCRLNDHEFDPGSPTRFEIGGRMADLLESYADRVERSGLVRVFAGDFYPSTLRAEAAEYRAGRDPHA
jgi:hypothetical protein